MQKILKVPTLIGIRRAVLEYSFENFTILGKKKNGKADKIHFTVLEDILLRCDCVGVDLFNGLANTEPYTQICKTSTMLP